MSDINRNFAIRILKLMRGGIKMGLPYTQDPVEKEIEQEQLDALNYAISSLETDEAYQLEYERTTKNDLGVDCISRKAVIDAINANCIWENEYNLTSSRIKKAVEHLPSVTPQEPILDKIRAEIEALPVPFTSAFEMKQGVLEILDKYKAESEVEDGNDD